MDSEQSSKRRWLRIAGLAVVVGLVAAGAIRLCWPLTEQGREPASTGPDGTLVIFHAGSLTRPMQRLSEAYRAQHPRARLRLEAAGSRHCARKIAALGRRADVFGSADYKVVENLLVPRHARFNVHFATNAMVIAYGERSRRRDEINANNWYRILADPEVRLGRSDPNSDPCGYRTVMVFQLAERHYGVPGLAAKLTATHGRTHIRPKETDLLALLESGEIDYLPIYRSVAVQHGLSHVALPPEVSLGDPSQAARYRQARVEVSGTKPGTTLVRRGEPIVYSLTIPRNAPNPEGGAAFVTFVLGEKGRAILERNGQPPLQPPRVTGRQYLPPRLERLLAPGSPGSPR